LIGGALVVGGALVLGSVLGAGVVVVLFGAVLGVVCVVCVVCVVVGVGGSPCASQAKPSRSRSSLRA
jgi:hypothetical protein